MAEKDRPHQVRKPYDFLFLGLVGQKGSPVEASPAKQGGIGNVRYIGDPFDSRRNTSVPQSANISGLPTFAAEMAKTGKPLKSQWPFQTKGRAGENKGFDYKNVERKVNPTPFNSKLGKGRKSRRPQSNIGGLMRGDIKQGKVRDVNTGKTFLMNRDDLLAGKQGKRKATGKSQGIGAQGPLVKEIADYERGMGTNPGEIQGVKLQQTQKNPEFGGDPSDFKTKSNFFKDENAYGKINVMIRDQKRKITDKIALNKGKDRQVVKTALDPKQVVETIDKDPDNLYNTERFEEKTLGKKMREATNEFKTPTIGKTALRELYRQGRATAVSEMTPAQIKGVGIDPAKIGTFAGVIDMGKTETSTTPLGNKQTKNLQRLIYAAKGSDGGVLKTKRTIPLNSRESAEVPEQLYRIGNPQAYDVDKVREAIAPYVGMEMKGEPTKEPRRSISLNQVRELQEKGYVFQRASEDGSRAVMTPPGMERRPENEINLTYEPRSKRFFLNQEYATYEVGPTAFMTRPGTRNQVTRSGALRTGDNVGGIRVTAEKTAPKDVVAGFDQIIKESIKSDSAPNPPDVTAQGRRYIADQIVRSKELGYSDDQVQQLLDITPPGSAARKDLVNAVVERYQEVSPNARRREINLFEENMGDVDVGARRLREVLTEMKAKGQPANTDQLYRLADFIGQRIDVPGNEIINAAGRRDYERPEFLATDIENQAKYGNGVNGYQLPKEELAIDQVGKDPIYTRGRGDITTNKPELMPRGVGNARMPYDLVGEVPLFASPLTAEANAIRAMAQADPTKLQAGSVETNKTSMLNAPTDQPLSGPIGRKPEEQVLQNRAYTDTVQVKNYAQMARFLGLPVGDPNQEKAMAAMAQRIAARLRR